jgi:predicted transcriptional regulator
MDIEPSVFDDDESIDAGRHAQAMAEIAAGRLIPNDEVCAWLETWGTPDEKPAPDSWFA